MLCADPVNPVWGPMLPWDPRYGRFGGAGGRFVGWGPVFVSFGPKNLWTRKKFGKNLEIFFFVVFSKNVFPSKTERFFFFFGSWCTLQGPCALKRLSRFQARNGPETLKKWIFLVLGAVLGETPAGPT